MELKKKELKTTKGSMVTNEHGMANIDSAVYNFKVMQLENEYTRILPRLKTGAFRYSMGQVHRAVEIAMENMANPKNAKVSGKALLWAAMRNERWKDTSAERTKSYTMVGEGDEWTVEAAASSIFVEITRKEIENRIEIDQKAAVDAALDMMKSEISETFSRWLSGEKQAEIAASMDITTRAVRDRLRKAENICRKAAHSAAFGKVGKEVKKIVSENMESLKTETELTECQLDILSCFSDAAAARKTNEGTMVPELTRQWVKSFKPAVLKAAASETVEWTESGEWYPLKHREDEGNRRYFGPPKITAPRAGFPGKIEGPYPARGVQRNKGDGREAWRRFVWDGSVVRKTRPIADLVLELMVKNQVKIDKYWIDSEGKESKVKAVGNRYINRDYEMRKFNQMVLDTM